MRIISHIENQNSNLYNNEDYIVTDKKFDLGEGFFYLDILSGFLLKDNQVIETTRLENEVIKSIVSKEGIITYEEIYRDVWKRTDVSIFTLRNIINKIRTKTYYNCIRNMSNHGYALGVKYAK